MSRRNFTHHLIKVIVLFFSARDSWVTVSIMWIKPTDVLLSQFLQCNPRLELTHKNVQKFCLFFFNYSINFNSILYGHQSTQFYFKEQCIKWLFALYVCIFKKTRYFVKNKENNNYTLKNKKRKQKNWTQYNHLVLIVRELPCQEIRIYKKPSMCQTFRNRRKKNNMLHVYIFYIYMYITHIYVWNI